MRVEAIVATPLHPFGLLATITAIWGFVLPFLVASQWELVRKAEGFAPAAFVVEKAASLDASPTPDGSDHTSCRTVNGQTERLTLHPRTRQEDLDKRYLGAADRGLLQSRLDSDLRPMGVPKGSLHTRPRTRPSVAVEGLDDLRQQLLVVATRPPLTDQPVVIAGTDRPRALEASRPAASTPEDRGFPEVDPRGRSSS